MKEQLDERIIHKLFQEQIKEITFKVATPEDLEKWMSPIIQ